MKFFQTLTFFILIISSCSFATNKQSIDLYTYIHKPPYAIDNNSIGLSYDFINALNQHSKKYTYNLIYLPKLRALDSLSQTGGVILWTNPIWMDDVNETKFYWIKDLFNDKELYITNDQSLVYEDVTSLHNKTLVGVRGYTYFELDESFKKHNILRANVQREVLIPDMLLKKRGEVGVMGAQTYWYLVRKKPEIADNLFILKGHNKEFKRSILVSKLSPFIRKEIEVWLSSPTGKKQWADMTSKWLQ